MTCSQLQKVAFGLALGVIVLALAPAVAAETVKIEGYIVGGSGDEIIVKFGGAAELSFQLTDGTKVSDIGELHSPRRKEMAMAALIPGLKVKVEAVS